MKIDYPIAIDSDHAIWPAFKNEYWPALYFVDAQGVFDIISSARANTNSRKRSFNNCWPRPESAASVMNWFRLMPVVWKLPPIGAA